MIYALGDIHGCLEKLKNLLEREGITNNDKWAAGSAHLVTYTIYTLDKTPKQTCQEIVQHITNTQS
jgi:hypothetical protein